MALIVDERVRGAAETGVEGPERGVAVGTELGDDGGDGFRDFRLNHTGSEMPPNPTLNSYIKFFVNSQYAGMEGLTDEFIEYSIQRCLNFYNSMNLEALQKTEPNVEPKPHLGITLPQITVGDAQYKRKQSDAAHSTRIWIFLAIWILPLIGMYMVQGDNPSPTFGPMSTWGVWFTGIPVAFWIYRKLEKHSQDE